MNKEGFPVWSDGKESACNAGDLGLIPGLGRSLEKGMATHSITLAWRILWQRSLVGYSPCGCKELDMTKHSTRELSDLLNLLYSVQGKFLPIQIH